MIYFLFFALLGDSGVAKATVLELSGTKGIEFMGFCVSKEDGVKKEISGITPTKITLDITIEKCSIQKKTAKGKLQIQLFHNLNLVTDKTLTAPMSGVELVIPFF